jgi:hypothetical protein
MTTYQGTYKAYPFRMTSKTSGSPDISSWTFHAKIRDKLTSAVLLDLTSANGGVVVTDGLNGRLELRMTAVQTATLRSRACSSTSCVLTLSQVRCGCSGVPSR